MSTPGFVLLIPVFGTDCGQRFIDNATWRIWDHRIVDCDTALAEAANGDLRQLTAARVDVIRDGFRRK